MPGTRAGETSLPQVSDATELGYYRLRGSRFHVGRQPFTGYGRFTMTRFLLATLFAAALLVAPMIGTPGIDSGASVLAQNDAQLEMVGQVVNTSSKTLKRRVQVRAGGREWTLHVPDDTPVTQGQQKLSVHNLDIGTYVRAIGRQIGDTRLRARKVFVIGDRLAFLRSGYARRNGEAGYVAAIAGYRNHSGR
jgi:hypothetical protein